MESRNKINSEGMSCYPTWDEIQALYAQMHAVAPSLATGDSATWEMQCGRRWV